MWKSRSAVALAAVAALALAGCSSSSSKTSTPAAKKTTLTVLAASSLTTVFASLGNEYESAHPGVTVKFSFGGSATLAQQITQGAPADVFAAASPATMTTVTAAGDAAGTPMNFVSNKLVIAVAPNNPKNITSLADLTKPGLKVVLCEADQPCGSAATKALAAGNVTVKPVSLAPDVKSALTTVELGEADAALVYVSDAKGADGKVTGIDFPEALKAINQYPIVALKDSKNLTEAQSFVSFIESQPALTELEAAGFLAPATS
jgi:molybdate transport system substrate-binding protein